MRTHNLFHASTFTELTRWISEAFRHDAHEVRTETWQGVDIARRPEMVSKELMNVHYTVDLYGVSKLDHWRQDVKPNLPWADNHFLERVCGRPINPGVEWENWPWGDNAAKFIEEGGMFNHNYMERYWPKHAHAGSMPTRTAWEWESNENEMAGDRPWFHNEGIRGPYGDLDNLLQLLRTEPLTRQAWMPIFFPEDTGNANPGRKPCTLGYQFIIRENQMHCYYPLRSCDFVRHWRDDIYLTIRLLLWILAELQKMDDDFAHIRPGSLTMNITSLHIFKNDYQALEK